MLIITSMLRITSLPKWETSHCYEDLKLVFPVSWGRGRINLELWSCVGGWLQLITLVWRLDLSRSGGTRVVWGLFLGTCFWIVPLRTCQSCLGLTISLHNFTLWQSVLHLGKPLPSPVSCNTSGHTPLFGRWWSLSSVRLLLTDPSVEWDAWKSSAEESFLNLTHHAAFLRY